MTVRLLYKEGSIFINHSHLYITTNTEPRLKPDEGLLRRGLLVETHYKFVTKEKYDLLSDIDKENPRIKIANFDIIDNLKQHDHKLAWTHLHLKYTIKIYKDNALHVLRFNDNFLEYCTDWDPWEQLKLSRLIITTDNNDRITKHKLADLYYHEYNRKVSDDTARDECIRVKLDYNKNAKSGSIRGLFVCVKFRPATNPNIVINETQNVNPLEIVHL